MEFVVVGDPGNKKDPIYKYGNVPYIYEISKHEITNEDYAEFLNAVAKFDDIYSLYSPSMTTGLFGGIDRFGQKGSYVYGSKKGYENRPVVYISWYDLARMANWCHYGKPRIGHSKLGTTEGTTNQGAYNTQFFPAGRENIIDYKKLPFRRNKRALFWIPNEHEWYKAAYYDPTIKSQRKYWNFPVRTNAIPNNVAPPGNQYSVNFFKDVFSIGKPYFLTEVGAYKLATSYYGTYDQGGNSWEWLENWRLTNRGSEKVRALRGGSVTYSEIGLHACNTDPGNPSHKKFLWGGRLAKAHITNTGNPIYSDVSYMVINWYLMKYTFAIKAVVWSCIRNLLGNKR